MATSALPQPPYSADLLADLHASNLPPDVARELWPLVRQDADALRILDALDRVTDELASLKRSEEIMHPIPHDVAARIDAALADADTPAPGPNAQVHSLAAARARRTGSTRKMGRWAAAAAAAVAVCVVTAAAITALRSGGGADQPIAGPVGSPSVPVRSTPAEPDTEPGPGLLTAIGRNDVSGPLADRVALGECLRAAGFNRTVLGARDARYQQGPAVLVLIAGPRPPGITALFVDPQCSPANPKVLGHTDIR